MLIIDGHLDLSMNALQWDRDLLQSVYTIRTQENYRPAEGTRPGHSRLPRNAPGPHRSEHRHAHRPLHRPPRARFRLSHAHASLRHGPWPACLLSSAGSKAAMSASSATAAAWTPHGRVGRPGTMKPAPTRRRRWALSSAWREPTRSWSRPNWRHGGMPGCACWAPPTTARALRRRHRHRTGPHRLGAAACWHEMERLGMALI